MGRFDRGCLAGKMCKGLGSAHAATSPLTNDKFCEKCRAAYAPELLEKASLLEKGAIEALLCESEYESSLSADELSLVKKIVNDFDLGAMEPEEESLNDRSTVVLAFPQMTGGAFGKEKNHTADVKVHQKKSSPASSSHAQGPEDAAIRKASELGLGDDLSYADANEALTAASRKKGIVGDFDFAAARRDYESLRKLKLPRRYTAIASALALQENVVIVEKGGVSRQVLDRLFSQMELDRDILVAPKAEAPRAEVKKEMKKWASVVTRIKRRKSAIIIFGLSKASDEFKDFFVQGFTNKSFEERAVSPDVSFVFVEAIPFDTHGFPVEIAQNSFCIEMALETSLEEKEETRRTLLSRQLDKAREDGDTAILGRIENSLQRMVKLAFQKDEVSKPSTEIRKAIDDIIELSASIYKREKASMAFDVIESDDDFDQDVLSILIQGLFTKEEAKAHMESIEKSHSQMLDGMVMIEDFLAGYAGLEKIEKGLSEIGEIYRSYLLTALVSSRLVEQAASMGGEGKSKIEALLTILYDGSEPEVKHIKAKLKI